MKTCTLCKEEKSLDLFSWKNKARNIKASECKECHKIMRREYYLNNTEKEKQRTSNGKIKRKDWFKGMKLTFKCSNCPEDHISCLDFHHTNPNEKEFNIAHAISIGLGKKKILDEISKCIILCANCHRKLHYAG